MQKRLIAPVLFLGLISLTSQLLGQVNVGDKPALRAGCIDGSPLNLETLRGRLVLIDFWATWCGPCMAEAGHMVAVNQQYGPKGLCIIGVSLDRDRNALMRVIREKGFVWPQVLDSANGGMLTRQFGVNAIPKTFLIGPDGDVLWQGHPSNMDGALTDAFQKHPPRLVDAKVLAAAGEAMDKIEAAVAQGNTAEAMKLFAKVPAEVRLDAKMGSRIEAAQKKLEEAAGKSLEDAESLISQKQFGEAVAKLKDLSKMNGLPVAAKASQKLSVVMAMPEAKAQIAAAEKAEREAARAEKATEALSAAQKLQTDGKHEQAYAAFKNVMVQFSGTPAAETASAAIKEYEKDPEFAKRANSASVERKATAMLNMAGMYKSAAKFDLARQRYQQVLDQFPNTTFAETAKKELESLPKE